MSWLRETVDHTLGGQAINSGALNGTVGGQLMNSGALNNTVGGQTVGALTPAQRASMQTSTGAQSWAIKGLGPNPAVNHGAFIDYAGSDNMNTVFDSVQTLNRKLWDDYMTNYKDREDKAYDTAFNTDFVGQALGRADGALNAADAAGTATAADLLSRYGQTQGDDQAAGTQALTQLGNGARRLATRNQAKWAALDTKEGLQTQMLDSYFQRVGSGVEGANQVGYDAAQRKAAYLRYRAAKKARAMGGLQAVVGTILLFTPAAAAGAALLAGGAAQGASANSQMHAEEKSSQNRAYAGGAAAGGNRGSTYGYGY